jgi:branched-chain amino acid aminotransferase
MENTLGVKVATDIKLFFIMSPCGPFWANGLKPISVYHEPTAIRCYLGGNGYMKIGANYGPVIYPTHLANQKGYDQLFWILNDTVLECGNMNYFMLWHNEQGEKELITYPLDGTILPGVTRMSVLELARSYGEFKVTKAPIKIQALTRAVDEGRVIEAFCTNNPSAATPISKFFHDGRDYDIPVLNNSAGALTA